MSADIITLPGAADRPITESEIDKLHSEAFRDLESDVSDLDRMGEIANDLIQQCVAREDGFHNLELATFAVWQLAKMLQEFRAGYYAAWDGQKKQGSAMGFRKTQYMDRVCQKPEAP